MLVGGDVLAHPSVQGIVTSEVRVGRGKASCDERCKGRMLQELDTEADGFSHADAVPVGFEVTIF
jgi:hypothetical protein